MPAFNMIVVGSGGGPDETNLSSYLIKPAEASWDEGVIGLEAGSGQGALNKILSQTPEFWLDKEGDQGYTAAQIYTFVRCYLVTHAHLDHISSLIMSAGSSTDRLRKRIYASEQCLQDLESVFSNRIWPNLASWKTDDENYKYLYSPLVPDGKYKTIHPQVSARIMPLSHGRVIDETEGEYTSSAFFVRNDSSGHEFLFFGDVEPDSLALIPRTTEVWRAAAPKIPAKLSTIFIECSWPSGRPNDMLHGHLSPEHLVCELTALAVEVAKVRLTATQAATANQNASPGPARKRQRRNPPPSIDLKNILRGLRVYIIHTKGCASDTPKVILEQVKQLVLEKGLGAEILLAEQGMRVDI
ncbi:3',5'-cyclic-nucleotide phosphodiesterase pde1 [Pleurotus ostreatus]|uniref:3',5'-cyclic-nucleotide phosphodiesterase pde1 n=1 Tax=Pleurotus ostreatus TaxID=5322 RepID=A0A8H7A2K7_PLEOS|nr:3',5'-cyclic-nucleotide phosphodiesterase pde1 [Pleurotus ostreatus]KAF7440935.1 3',5'-cyclic-nucleotide phosphodiesterase pde1 [Pleurotus ostreatus]KAJ8699619.1 3',5'-cyclic-nucleotide phosphodiesterase pde1 [Pleurotus ostreatus]